MKFSDSLVNYLVDSVKLKIQIVYDPTVTFLGVQPTEMSTYVH